MQGRVMLVVLIAGVLAVGCASAQEKQARAEQKQARAQAKAEEKQRKEEAKLMAKEDKARREEEQALAEKQRKEEQKMEKEQRHAIGADMIRDERHVRALDRFVQAESAAGAREDAMLNDAHFDGGELNALGRSKLALIARATPSGSSQPVLVYVSGASDAAEARSASAQAYWKASPYSAMTLQLKPGVNEAVVSPAAAGIAGLKKMEESSRETAGGTAMGTDTTGSRGRLGNTGSSGSTSP